jgi:hypothetical protein
MCQPPFGCFDSGYAGSDDCSRKRHKKFPAATPGRICTSGASATWLSWTRRAPTRRASHFHHTPAAPAAGSHLSNGSSFRSAPDQHRVSPRASQLLTESPTLAPTWLPHQVVGRQGFPRYVLVTAVDCAAVLSVVPSLRLPRVCLVSVPRDSKAGHLPGTTVQRTPDYLFRGNGSANLHKAPSPEKRGAVTRLSYTGTPGFPRCRQSQISPLRPSSFRNRCQPTCVALVTPLR